MQIPKTKYYIFQSIILAFLIFIITNEDLIYFRPLQSLEQKIIDSYIIRRGTQKYTDSLEVIIIGISNQTIEELPEPLNKWPLQRNLFAKAIENLNRAGVKVIGIDLLFSESDRYSEKNDSLMIKSLNKYDNIILAGKLEKIDLRYQFEKTSDKNYGNVFHPKYKRIGLVNVLPDDDGVLRRYIPFYFDRATNTKIPSFAFAVINKYFNLPPDFSPNSLEKVFVLNDIIIPKFTGNSVFINFYGPSGTFSQIDLIDILDDKDFKTRTELETGEEINIFDDENYGLLYSGRLKDKIVLIGSVEPEDKDLLPVPILPKNGKSIYGNLMYGVEIHANVIQMIIDKNFLVRGSLSIRFLIIFILIFVSLNIFKIFRQIKLRFAFLGELINLIFVLCILLILYEVYYYLFTHLNLIRMFIPPALGLLVAYVGSAVFDFIKERKQKAMIKSMFSQYLNPELVNELINNPEKLRLGGIRKNMTVLFSDLANFTTISERTEPEILVEMLNQYFDEMTEIIFECGGTLDKFEGDAIMAFWNAPLDDDKHHFNACLSAIKMKKKVEEMRKNWKAMLGFDFSIRIGINSGEMIVGNMGGKKKFDYTVMGDNVNLAARLESINKIYGTDIVISEFCYEYVKNEFLCRELDLILVKGKTIPVKIYQILDLKSNPIIYNSEEVKSLELMIKYFAKGLAHYRAKEFLRAIEEFEKVYLIDPDDQPTKVFIERCFEYLNVPPPEDWNGVFESKIK